MKINTYMEQFLDNIISEDVFTETDNLRLNLIENNLLLLFIGIIQELLYKITTILILAYVNEVFGT
jgi:hypothetical protein